MNRCPMCLHPVHLAFACAECSCELDAIEAYDAGGGDFEFELPVGSRERARLEGTLDDSPSYMHISVNDVNIFTPTEEGDEEDEGALDTEMDYDDLASMQY